MAKPTIVTRAGKGSPLTFTEGDSNLTNLRDATLTVAGDSGSIVNDLNGSFTIAGGTGLSSSASSTTLTVNLDNTAVTAGSYTYASITVDAQGRLTAASNGTAPSTTTINISTTDGNTSDTTLYPVLVGSASTGDQAPHIDSGSFFYNGATNTLTVSALITGATNGPNLQYSSSAITTSAWTSNGVATQQPARTYTDSSSSGTVAANYINTYGVPTLASTNSTTVTEAATMYVADPVAGTNTTLTNKHSLVTGGSVKVGTRLVLKDLTETVYSLTYGATITPNVANGTVQVVTLTGGVTFNAFTSPVAGQSLTLIIKQDATGSRTLTSTGIKWAGGAKTLSTAANSIDIATVFYDGTNYWGSLSKGFA